VTDPELVVGSWRCFTTDPSRSITFAPAFVPMPARTA